MKPRKPYPSDINQAQFEKIRPLLDGVRKSTVRGLVRLRTLFDAPSFLITAWQIRLQIVV
jgi:hypothetical protein